MPGQAIIVEAIGPILSAPFVGGFVFAHQAVAGPDPRKAVLFGEEHYIELALFGFDGPAVQLYELPFGADERPAVFLLVGTAFAATRGECRYGCDNCDSQQNLHSIFLNVLCKYTEYILSLCGI